MTAQAPSVPLQPVSSPRPYNFGSSQSQQSRKSPEKAQYGRSNIPLIYQLIRNQVEYYFSNENLNRDTYLRNALASNGGRVPVSLIASFPKIQILYNTHGVTEDCCTLIAKAMTQSHVVEIEGIYLCPKVNKGYPPVGPPRSVTYNDANDSYTTDSFKHILSCESSTSSALSTHGEVDWTSQYQLKGDSSFPNRTLSPGSYGSETRLPLCTNIIGHDDNKQESVTPCPKNLDYDPSVSLKSLTIEDDTEVCHQESKQPSKSLVEQKQNQMQPPIETVYYEHPSAPTFMYPAVSAYVPDQYYSNYYFQQPYLPVAMSMAPTPVDNASSTTQQNHLPPMAKGFVVDAFYPYSYYYPYQYDFQQYQYQQATQPMLQTTANPQVALNQNNPSSPPHESTAKEASDDVLSLHAERHLDTKKSISQQGPESMPGQISIQAKETNPKSNKSRKNYNKSRDRPTTNGNRLSVKEVEKSNKNTFSALRKQLKENEQVDVKKGRKNMSKSHGARRNKRNIAQANILSEENFPALQATNTRNINVAKNNSKASNPTLASANSMVESSLIKTGYAAALLKQNKHEAGHIATKRDIENTNTGEA